MIKIFFINIKCFFVVVGLVLVIFLVVVVNQVGLCGGDCGVMDGCGYYGKYGGDMGYVGWMGLCYLCVLNLIEVQCDKVFEIQYV